LFAISPRNGQALAWEVNYNNNPPIVEKNGGLNNSSTYIGLIPEQHLGIVILTNRGNQNPAAAGRVILHALSAPD
ncbi:MAG: serine hydrolase, partial [Acidobacteriota bacterium]